MSRATDAYGRGDVVWAEDPFKAGDTARPWLVLSSNDHPFHGEQYVCCLLTTTPRTAAVSLNDDDWTAGGTPEKSYVNPWVPMSLDHGAAINRQGTLRRATVDEVAVKGARYVGAEPS